MARPDKHAAVTEISELFRNSSATLLTEYRRLTVSQFKQLRGSLQTTTYAVVKNTLTRLAAKDAGVEGIDEWLVGPSPSPSSSDPVEAAKGCAHSRRTTPPW